MPTTRHKLTEDMLLQHIEALTNTEDTMAAATASGVSYPTYLARFRRVGLKVVEVREQVVNGGVMPEVIVAKAFKKVAKKDKGYKILNFKHLQEMLETVSNQLNKVAA